MYYEDCEEWNKKLAFKSLASLKLGLSDLIEDRIKNGESVEPLEITLRFKGNHYDDSFEQLIDPYLQDIEIVPYGEFIAQAYDFYEGNETCLHYSFKKSKLYEAVYETDIGDGC